MTPVRSVRFRLGLAVMLLFSLLAGIRPPLAAAASVTFTPAPLPFSDPEVSNPGRGLYRWRGQTYMCQPGQASNQDNYERVTWAEVEKYDAATGVYYFDWGDLAWKIQAAANRGQRTWVGFAMTAGNAAYGPYLPAYMIQPGWGEYFAGVWYPNYNNPAVQARLEALLDSFEYNFIVREAGITQINEHIAGLEMRSYGSYGEGYIPWNAPANSSIWATEPTARWMIDAWHTRFSPYYRLAMPAVNRFIFHYTLTQEPKWGWIRNAMGHELMDDVDKIITSPAVVDGQAIGPLMAERWKHAPVVTEMIGDYSGAGPKQFTMALTQTAKYHVSLVSNGNFINAYQTGPWNFWNGSCAPQTTNWTATDIANFIQAGKTAGYRYRINNVTVDTLTPGQPALITTQWKNEGNAPTYDPWQVKFQLRSAGTVVWEDTSSVNLRTIHSSATPITTIQDTFPLPASLPAGSYQLHLLIPPFSDVMPSMKLANAGLAADGSYALGAVTVGSAPPPPGPLALRGTTTGGANATTLTLNRPAGTQAGDVLIAHVAGRNPSLTMSAPSGWTLIRRDFLASTIDQRLYYRVATTSEPASYAWTASGATHLGGGIAAYSGVNTTTPINAQSGQAVMSASVTAPSVTTTVANTQLVFIGSLAWGYASFSPPAGMVERSEQKTSNVNVSSETADALQAAVGATGARTATASASNGNVGQLIALHPALAAAPITLRSSSTSDEGTIPTPAGVVAGDVMIAQVTSWFPPYAITPPSGWTLIRHDANWSNVGQSLYYRVATANEPENYTWTSEMPTTIIGGILAYSGTHPTTPIGAHAGQSNRMTAIDTAPSVTTTMPNSRLLFFGGTMADAATFTPAIGMTERYEVVHTQAGFAAHAADWTQASAGPTGTRSALMATTWPSIGQLLVLQPAP